MIKFIHKFYLDSYSFDFKADGNFIKSLDYCSVTNIYFEEFYQIQGQILILIEGDQSVDIPFDQITYKTKDDLMLDLGNKLTQFSPNNFVYTVTNSNIPDINGKIKIECNDPLFIDKSINMSNVLRKCFGFDIQIVGFRTLLISDFKINLTPLNFIYIRSDMIKGLTQNENNGDILTIYPTQNFGYITYDLIGNAKSFGGNTNLKLYFTDEDGLKFTLSTKFLIEICLFKLEDFHILNKFALTQIYKAKMLGE